MTAIVRAALALAVAACTAGAPPPEQAAGTITGIVDYDGAEAER